MKLAYHLSILSKINQPIHKPLKIESMAEVKQSLQEIASKERESYKSVFLKKRSVCNRQSVYISGEIQETVSCRL